jgi:uncharacterized NAD(P)/FAD-binding protein YdhS
VLIVGAGLAGTATAIRLLCFARDPIEIVLLERRREYRSAGVAYHRDGNPWDHVFNVQAGRMSAFREDVLDFVRWANHEADRRDWPAPWAEFEFVEQGPAPRRIFQDYLTDRLAAARREACAGVELVELDGEAIDLRVQPTGVAVTVCRPEAAALAGGPAAHAADSVARAADSVVLAGDPVARAADSAVLASGPAVRVADSVVLAGDPAARAADPAIRTADTTVLRADQVILATGLELREPPFAAQVLDHPCFIRNPYSAAAVRRLETLPAEASVAIVGSVLSAYDSAALLLRRGHTGTIHLISRSGTVFRTYPDDHEHGVVRLPCPQALLQPYRDRAEFLGRVRAEWDAACASVAREHPDIAPAVVAERVTKAWEPHLPAAIERIPSGELRRLLDEFSTPISSLRVCAVEYTMSVIERALGPEGRLRLHVGRVEEIVPTREGRLNVSVAGSEGRQVVEADLVVSNFAREPDYSRVGGPLWRSLLRQGLAVPHARTGRGLEVDEHGALLAADGSASERICAVGVLREGDEIVRNGRTGAFAFNLATIKNQSITAAAHVLERLELSGLERGRLGTLEQAASPGFEEAVVLEVRRLAMRTRTERERLDARLGARIRAAAELPGLPEDTAPSTRARLLRAVVNRAAVARLTDVSVTPRQLRRDLGLAGADDPEG